MTTGARRRRLRPATVAAAAVLVAIVEVVVLVLVARWVGAWPTILLVIATSVLGVWLIRREGSRAWRALQQAVRSGRMPARELADGMLVLVGGTLLTGPGFVTDLVGLLLVLPFTRPVARNLLAAVISRRMLVQSPFFTGPQVAGPPGRRGSQGWPHPGTPDGPRRSRSSGEIIEGEIIEDPPADGTRH